LVGTPGAEALLLVDHGSRRPAANEQLEAVAERIRARRPELIVEVAHMEIAPPDVAEGIERCVRRGASRVVVHPYFLGPGNHSQEDIPRMAEDAAARHPGLEVVVSAPLGVHEGLVDAVLDRYDEADGP
jgi:sirohydrochlorin ferrochelatase